MVKVREWGLVGRCDRYLCMTTESFSNESLLTSRLEYRTLGSLSLGVTEIAPTFTEGVWEFFLRLDSEERQFSDLRFRVLATLRAFELDNCGMGWAFHRWDRTFNELGLDRSAVETGVCVSRLECLFFSLRNLFRPVFPMIPSLPSNRLPFSGFTPSNPLSLTPPTANSIIACVCSSMLDFDLWILRTTSSDTP